MHSRRPDTRRQTRSWQAGCCAVGQVGSGPTAVLVLLRQPLPHFAQVICLELEVRVAETTPDWGSTSG